MNRFVRAAALLLAALLILALSACGETDPNAGRYVCTEILADGETLRPGDLFAEDCALELSDHGRGRIRLGGEEGAVRWSLEGESLSLDVNGIGCAGSLRDGEITLTLPESGVTLRLCREEMAAARARSTEPPELLRQLAGDWYGRWEITESSGSMPETWYDCCASGRLSEDGLLLTLWDEQSSRMEPMGAVRLSVDGDAVRSAGGWLWFDEIAEGEWSICPPFDVIELSGKHDAEGESFRYHIVLRPWGAEWEEEEPRPYSYRFWYLPLIEAGEGMPDEINGK